MEMRGAGRERGEQLGEKGGKENEENFARARSSKKGGGR